MIVKLFGTDLETTGFDAADGNMVTEIAISIVKLDTEKLEVVDRKRWSTLVNPKRGIPQKVQDITGITPDMVKDSPEWHEIAQKVKSVIKGCDVFVAHNANFDAPFMYHMFEKTGMEMPEIEIFCTMQQGRWATPDGKVPKLAELCRACRIDFDEVNAHRAWYDTEKMMDALVYGLQKGFFEINWENVLCMTESN